MNGSQIPRKHFTYYYHFIIEGIIKVINPQPDEEVHTARSRRVSHSGAEVPPPGTWMHFTNLEAPRTASCRVFLEVLLLSTID